MEWSSTEIERASDNDNQHQAQPQLHQAREDCTEILEL
jgi:hypothetical protein